MSTRRTLALAITLTLVGLDPAFGARFQSFSGNNRNAPTFTRPSGAGPGLGSTVHYRSQKFQLLSPSECTIYSAQDYDGYLHLYENSFNPNSPLTNLIDGDDDAELGIGTSRIPSDRDQDAIDLDAGIYFLVSSGFNSSSEGSFQNFLQCDNQVQPIQGTCFFGGFPREQQLCLRDRFAVSIDNVTNHPGDGRATPVRFASDDSAFFWFFNDKNYEVMVKVLNGCAINGHYWVFIAGTTNQGHRIRVGDVTDNTVLTYTRFEGPPAEAINDTLAFDCP